MMKKCNKCKKEKELECFYNQAGTTDGLHTWCRTCVNAEAKEYRLTHPEEYKKSRQKYAAKTVLQRRLYKREYDKKLMLNPLHRLNNNIRGGMYHALKGLKGFRKWEGLIGYTLEDLVRHLESQFTEGISWANYGTEWHVDHVIPKSWFKYVSTEDAKFKECWALKNLQPKLKVDNIRKGNRFSG